MVTLLHRVVVLPELGYDLPRLSRHPGLVLHAPGPGTVFEAHPLHDSLDAAEYHDPSKRDRAMYVRTVMMMRWQKNSGEVLSGKHSCSARVHRDQEGENGGHGVCLHPVGEKWRS